jgi:hypothetical protein
LPALLGDTKKLKKTMSVKGYWLTPVVLLAMDCTNVSMGWMGDMRKVLVLLKKEARVIVGDGMGETKCGNAS